MTLPDLDGLPPVTTRRGEDPQLVAGELLRTISAAILSAPRNQQRTPGPSELGNPCDRALFYKLAGVEPANIRETEVPNLKAQFGSAMHSWLDDTFGLDNTPGQTRWLRETRVNVGQIGGKDITGSCDLYDRRTCTVIDWKTTTRKKIQTYRKGGPGELYRQQAHLYGRGWTRRGLPVDTVMVVFLPRDGDLSDAFVWWEPYDEQVALATLARAEALHTAAAALGAAGAQLMRTVDHYCNFCPFYRAGSTNLTEACPGDATRTTRTDPITALIA